MRKYGRYAVALALMLMLCAFFYPSERGELGESVFAIKLGALFAAQPQDARADKRLSVYDEALGRVVSLKLEEYVAGVVLAEMPPDFADEALKAQAVAARTFAVNKCKSYGGRGCARRAEADVCTSPGCCQGYTGYDALAEKLGARGAADAFARATALTLDTEGEIITFAGAPIQALYHACSGGYTENAEHVYAQALAYLRSVESPGEAEYPQYSHTQMIDFTSLKAAFHGIDGAQLTKLAPLSDQLEVLTYTPTGRVDTIRVGLARLTGAQFRKLTGLRSANFKMSFEGGSVIFETTGYGHGVGMSQTGADAMARRGGTYADILGWYYTGVELARLDTLTVTQS